MDKYYISKINIKHDLTCNNEFTSINSNLPQSQFTCVQYQRKPPSFGCITVHYDDLDEGNRRGQQFYWKIILNSLLYSEGNEVKFEQVRVCRLIFDNSHIDNKSTIFTNLVSCDVFSTIELDSDTKQKASARRLPDGLALSSTGHIIGVWFDPEESQLLADDKLYNNLQGDVAPLTFIQIRIQKSLNDDVNYATTTTTSNDMTTSENDHCFVHILSKCSYFLYRLSSPNKNFHLIGQQKANKNEDIQSKLKSTFPLEYVTAQTIPLNPSWILLSMSDLTVRFSINSSCVATINGNYPLNKPLTILHGNSTREFMLLSHSSSSDGDYFGKINAQLITVQQHQNIINDKVKQQWNKIDDFGVATDPDNLLPREPSFEIEDCWQIDLQEIDSIRLLIDNSDNNESTTTTTIVDNGVNLDSNEQICITPIWSINESPKRENYYWPKFLIISYKFHLLAYKFELQSKSMPFSVVYDKSFLKLISGEMLTQTAENTDNLLHANDPMHPVANDEPDVRLKPKLVHNWKLIGSQPGDAIYNTIFLANSQANPVYFTELRIFELFSLIIGLTNSGHLIGFKLTSNKLGNLHKDNILQQMICDALRNEKLLMNQEKTMQIILDSIRKDLANSKSLLSSQHDQLNNRSDITSLKTTTLDQEQLIAIDLKQREKFGSLYDLKIELFRGLELTRILIASSNLNSYMLNQNGLDPSNGIRNILISNNWQTKTNLGENDQLSLLNEDKSSSIKSWCLIELDSSKENSFNGSASWKKGPIVVSMLIGDQHESLALDIDNHNAKSPKLIVSCELAAQRGQSSKQSSKTLKMLRNFDNNGLANNDDSIRHIMELQNELPSSISRAIMNQMISAEDDNSFRNVNYANRTTLIPITTSKSCHLTSFPISPLQSYMESKSSKNFSDPSSSGKDKISCEYDIICNNQDETNLILNWLSKLINNHISSNTQINNSGLDEMIGRSIELQSPFTHCKLLIYKQEGRLSNVVTIKSIDLAAVNLIKKYILKRATDCSIRIDIRNNRYNTNEQCLLQSIQLQLVNIQKMKDFGGLFMSQNGSESLNNDNRRDDDLLIETILLEAESQTTSSNDLFDSRWLTNSIRQDLTKLTLIDDQQANEAMTMLKADSDNAKSNHVFEYQRLISKFIIASLIAFNELQDVNAISGDKIDRFRLDLDEILISFNRSTNNKFNDTITFSNYIVSQWKKLVKE